MKRARKLTRSSRGTKLYAVRGKDGKFRDIQTYKRAPLCAGCGKYRADPPSALCPGCEAYAEHQR